MPRTSCITYLMWNKSIWSWKFCNVSIPEIYFIFRLTLSTKFQIIVKLTSLTVEYWLFLPLFLFPFFFFWNVFWNRYVVLTSKCHEGWTKKEIKCIMELELCWQWSTQGSCRYIFHHQMYKPKILTIRRYHSHLQSIKQR